MDKEEKQLLLDILERVNRDPNLVREINAREDLQYPDLHVAWTLAKRLVVSQ